MSEPLRVVNVLLSLVGPGLYPHPWSLEWNPVLGPHGLRMGNFTELSLPKV